MTSQYVVCGECFLALGDAHVLSGNFPAAIDAYEEAYEVNLDLEIAVKKIALLKCVSKVFKIMERQHSDLLNTIDDVHNLKDRFDFLI